MFAEARLRNASVILLIVGVHLVIPRLSEVGANFADLTSSSSRVVASKRAANMKNNSQNLDTKNDRDEEFEPPNNKGPHSERGSGTR